MLKSPVVPDLEWYVMSYGIAIDIGTSGIRAQAIDLTSRKIISTAITLRHPLPGANVMDHLHFVIETSMDLAHSLVIDAINRLLHSLEVDLNRVERIAVSGNPTQLSIFQGIEIRDLAYWGEDFLKRKGIEAPPRAGDVVEAGKLGLKVRPEAEVYIPPAIKHEVGADALAMLVETGVLNKRGVYLVVDFGTNAEIALSIDGEVYTCSAAAGPAIEGQRIEKGMLASPGAISDVNVFENRWKCYVLDSELIAREGDLVDPFTGEVVEKGEMHGKAVGITGTGVIAVICEALRSRLIKVLPRIDTKDRMVHLQDGIYITTKDVIEAGKAIGAFRAGYIALAEESGITLEEINAVYMAGASGFYVDAYKSMEVGQIPPCVKEVYQVGNTSLAMARDIVLNPELFDHLKGLAKEMRGKHVMLATSKVFEKVYPLELSYWQEGMPLSTYNMWLRRYNYQELPRKYPNPTVKRLFARDIPVLGEKGLRVIRDIGLTLIGYFEGCTACGNCVSACPEKAMTITVLNGRPTIIIKTELCDGTACLRCERSCPQRVFRYRELLRKI